MKSSGGLSAFRESIVRAYGSVESPNWGFVGDVVRRQPYSALFDDLARKFPVEDDTDVNDEVAFTFLVTAQRVLSVKLSMVGPYAAVLAVSSAEPDAPLTVLSRPEDAANDDERAVLLLLDQHGFRLLTEEELERSVRFQLEDAAIVPLYRALFAFEGLLPWKPW